jgi:hypothetical protein
MKTSILSLLVTIFTSLAVYAQSDEDPSYFGEKIDAENANDVTELPEMMADQNELTAKVKGKVQAVCQAKGCWMDIDLGNGEVMKVKFKDYGFFVPKDIAGSNVVIEGIARREMVDVETLQHYAEDAGKSEEEVAAIKDPEEKYTFEAIGVIVQ